VNCISYKLKKRRHWQSMTHYCSPCQFHYEYITKQEDAEFDYPTILNISGYKQKYPKLHIPARSSHEGFTTKGWFDISEIAEPYKNLSPEVIKNLYKNYFRYISNFDIRIFINHFSDFVTFNYSIEEVLNAVEGTNNAEILTARQKVKELLGPTMVINMLVDYNNICESKGPQKYEWKKLVNFRLGGLTKLGWKKFNDFEEAKLAAINDADSNGFTYDKISKTYTLRRGSIVVNRKNEDSWVKIPL